MYRKAFAFLIAAAPLAAAPLHAQTPIRVGETVSGTLDDSDPRLENGGWYDAYVIRGRPGDRVLVRMRSSDFDAYLHWGYTERDGVWFEEAANDDGGEGTDSRLLVTLGTGGTYELRASAFGEDEGGAYELELATPAAPQQAERIRVGETVEGELTERDYEGGNGFEDHYVLSGAPGGPVTLFVESTDFDTYVAVGTWSDGAFQELDSDDDGGEDTNSQLVVQMDGAPGELRVVVRAFSGDATGAYTLRAAEGAFEPEEDEEMDGEMDEEGETDFTGIGREGMFDEEAPIDEAAYTGSHEGGVQAGAEVRGTLGDAGADASGELHFYREYSYRAGDGEAVRIHVWADELDPYVSVGTGTGDEFTPMAEDDDGGEELDSLLEWQVPQAGTYTIRVTSAFPGQTGPFILKVESLR